MSCREIDFEFYRIGMPRSEIVLLDHNPQWADCFKLISDLLCLRLVKSGIEFFHVGSTSIPIKAKPILDIMGVVPEITKFDAFQSDVEKLGFVWKGEYGIAGRRYCVKYDESKTIGYIHLHIFEKKNPEVEKHLLFRNYLLAFPEIAAEYSLLKERLIVKFGKQRERYTEAKAEFIQSVLEKAKTLKLQ